MVDAGRSKHSFKIPVRALILTFSDPLSPYIIGVQYVPTHPSSGVSCALALRLPSDVERIVPNFAPVVAPYVRYLVDAGPQPSIDVFGVSTSIPFTAGVDHATITSEGQTLKHYRNYM